MPQMLIIQPAVPQAPHQDPQSGSPEAKEQCQFSPHLENAISSNKPKQQAKHDKDNTDTLPKSDEAISSNQNKQDAESQDTQHRAEVLKENSEQTSLTDLYAESTPPITNSINSKSRQVESSTNLFQNVAVKIGNEPITSNKSPGSLSIQPELPRATTEPAIPNPINPSGSKGQDALISQLQHIIDNANETGTVSITRVGRNTSPPHSISSNIHGITTASLAATSEPISVATNTETSELNLNGLLGTNIDGIEKTGGKPTQQLNGLRHDSQQQYYNAKINTQNLAENNQNSQENKQGDELSQKNLSSSLQSSPLGAAEQSNTFSQISTLAQENTTQLINEAVKQVILPSGTIIQEEEIIHQLTQRFQISSKNMDSRINLKLHPAELGELKIDLTVKEGSIRANVVAQSQHTLEILEKNIPKLKTMLENQGFTVDEIMVTAESDSVGDFDLFDQQLFSHNDYTPTAQKENHEDEVLFTLDDSQFAVPATSTGVNVKI